MFRFIGGVFIGLAVAGVAGAQSSTAAAPSSLSTGRPLSAPSVAKPSFTTLTTSVELFPIGFTEFALSGSVIGTGRGGESTTYALHQGTDAIVTLVEGPSGLSEHGVEPSVGLVVDIQCAFVSGSAFCTDTAVQGGSLSLVTTASGPVAFTSLPILTASPVPTSAISSGSAGSSGSSGALSSIASLTSPPASGSVPSSPTSNVSSPPPASSPSTTGSGSGRAIASGTNVGIGMTIAAMVGSFVWTLL